MTNLNQELELERCPHCNVDKPSLVHQWNTQTDAHSGGRKRWWKIYKCSRCGGLVLAGSTNGTHVTEIYPDSKEVDGSIPERAKDYLQQARSSLHAPAGAVMLAASSIDAMLKEKGYKEGSLYNRIDKAEKDNLITKEMAQWAHQVRLDANDQRHSDETSPLPNDDDAKKSIDFACALGEFLFVLPARVNKGLQETS